MKQNATNRQITCTTAKELARHLSANQSIPLNHKPALRSHLETCTDCRTDFALLKLFLDDRNSGLDELSSKRCRDAAIAHARSQDFDLSIGPVPSSPLPPPAPRHLLAAIAVAASILTIAGIGMMLSPGWDHQETTTAPRTEKNLSPMVSNDIPQNETSTDKTCAAETAALKEGAPISTSLLNPASGVLVYTEENTLVSIAERTENRLTLDLQTGAIWVDVNPEISHPSVTVRTPDGSVHVTGTVFRVAKSRRFVVQVLRGEVTVLNAQGSHPVNAGYESNIQKADINAIDKDLQAKLTASWKNRIDSKRSAFSVEIASDDSTSSTTAPQKKLPPSFTSLIATAREKKAKSDLIGAIESYQKLIRLYPSKPESKAALVTVGQLYLKQGNAPLAEKAFRQYQTQGNTLLGPEALLGESDALRMQGKTDEELNALKLFARLYPQSLHNHRVSKRIAQIESGQ